MGLFSKKRERPNEPGVLLRLEPSSGLYRVVMLTLPHRGYEFPAHLAGLGETVPANRIAEFLNAGVKTEVELELPEKLRLKGAA
jgi:hypothetical protein